MVIRLIMIAWVFLGIWLVSDQRLIKIWSDSDQTDKALFWAMGVKTLIYNTTFLRFPSRQGKQAKPTHEKIFVRRSYGPYR